MVCVSVRIQAILQATPVGQACGLILQELNNSLTLETQTSMIVDRSAQGDLLRINFNISFPALSCEFATLDVSDALGTVGLRHAHHIAHISA